MTALSRSPQDWPEYGDRRWTHLPESWVFYARSPGRNEIVVWYGENWTKAGGILYAGRDRRHLQKPHREHQKGGGG